MLLAELTSMGNGKKLRYCEKLRTNLIEGLKARLGFVESKPLYVHAAILTPKYGFKWLTPTERRNFDKESFIQAIESFLLKKPLLKNNQVNLDKDQEICEPSKKKIKLLNFMNVYSDLCPSAENESKTILKQLDDYLLLVNRPGDINTRDFWLH